MYDHTLHRGRKYFCHYCLETFSSEEISKRHDKNCFEIKDKQRIQMPKEIENVEFKNFARKIKLPFITDPHFESILVLEDNGKQSPEDSYTNKYQKNVFCSYGYKLVCVHDKFS